MENSFNLIFYIKKTKADPNGKTMIYMRITLNGRRSELSIQRKASLKKGRQLPLPLYEMGKHWKKRLLLKKNGFTPKKFIRNSNNYS